MGADLKRLGYFAGNLCRRLENRLAIGPFNSKLLAPNKVLDRNM